MLTDSDGEFCTELDNFALAGDLALEVATEVARARSMFPAIYSPHEGLAIIREEYLEFEEEVWKYNPYKNRDTRPQMRTELIQLAAMALRTILDTIDKEAA